ncbi:MAG: transporter [Thermodesulfobacteriota bacterium]
MMAPFPGAKIFLGGVAIFLALGLIAWPAAAQGPEAPAISLEKPATPAAAEKKEEAPATTGPIIGDTCLPIATGKFALQVYWALSFYTGNFSPNWRRVSAGGNFYTWQMPVKFTYGPIKDTEVYVIIPFIANWANSVNPDLAGPKNERAAGYSGIGDISLIGKYNLLPETADRPAVTAVAGFATIPTGHASRLNPGRLGQDAIGTGSLSFATGVNLHKYLQPFLLHGQIWYNAPVNIQPAGPGNVRNTEWVTVNLAAELPFTRDKKWVLLLEMYSNWTWSNLDTPTGFQTPTTLLGVLPAIEYVATDKLSCTAGTAFDLVGKFGSQKITPVFTVLYNF